MIQKLKGWIRKVANEPQAESMQEPHIRTPTLRDLSLAAGTIYRIDNGFLIHTLGAMDTGLRGSLVFAPTAQEAIEKFVAGQVADRITDGPVKWDGAGAKNPSPTSGHSGAYTY